MDLASAHDRFDEAYRLLQAGDAASAQTLLQTVVAAYPQVPQPLLMLGVSYHRLGDRLSAIATYDRAIAVKPDFAKAWSNRGAALRDLNRLDDAVASYDRAIAIDPGLAEAHLNRGNALKDLGRSDEALASYDRAIAADALNADAHHNKALLLLLEGDYAAGWKLYEWRARISGSTPDPRLSPGARWRGGDGLAGRTILLTSEQGMGDVVQFCRYALLLDAMGARVCVEVPPPLAALVRTLGPGITVIAQGEALPPFDYHCPLLSLPLALGTTPATIPAPPGYLHADPAKQAWFAQRLPTGSRIRVGVAWSGSTTNINDHNRSIGLNAFAPLMAVDAEFHCLQNEFRDADAAVLAGLPQLRRWERELREFSDTAALASLMDVVVTVDTSVAHVAAAIGRPTWILLPHSPDFRWFREREDSPWYPTVRLFRQRRAGDWDGVIGRARDSLAAFCDARAGPTGAGR